MSFPLMALTEETHRLADATRSDMTLEKAILIMRKLIVAALLLFCSVASAQIVERIDVTPAENDAEIVIRFSRKILYMRHAPQNNGKVLRVFFRLIDGSVRESELMQQSMRAPETERVPTAMVVYPELVNGMLVTFPQETSFSVNPGRDGHSIVIRVPLLPAINPVAAPTALTVQPTEAATAPIVRIPPVPVTASVQSPAAASESNAVPSEPLPTALPPAMSASEVESRTGAYLEEARQAIAAKDPATAINRLNRILGLPASSQTEPAQALIGEARELNGEILKARAEYDLYLKLFPNGSRAAHIRERLTALPKDEAIARAAPRPLPKEAGPAEWTYNGSLATYYYTGSSQIDSLSLNNGVGGTILSNKSSLSMTDQHSLITSLNLNARRRDAFTDTRFVLRDTDNKNYLSPSRSYNRLYSAYVDHTDRNIGYSVRLGRQNPNGIGVLDRFDGVQAGYNLNPQWRVNAVYGDAVEFNSPYKKSFYGASVDLLPQMGKLGVSAYAIEQTLDGLTNRRAVGSEFRYFDGKATAYGMLDYDVLYKGINIAMLQGNYVDEGGNNYFFVIDRRQAPSYSLTNALPSAPGLTLQEMVAAQGLESVRTQASALTAVSNMFSIGVTHPLSEKWQAGVDYRLSSISSTQPVIAVIPLSALGGTCLNGTIDFVNSNCVFDTASGQGSGNTHVVTFQAIGSSLFVANAVGVGNLSLIEAPTYTGQALSASYVLPLGEQWRLDTNLRYYTQKDKTGSTLDRLSPSVKLSYQWQNSLYLESEIGLEKSNTNAADRVEKSRRDYIFVGLRWDFR